MATQASLFSDEPSTSTPAPARRVRATSDEAFHAITEQGLLVGMRLAVYSFLYDHGPLTAGELTRRMRASDEVNPSYHKRLSELRDLGVVGESSETRACSVTGLRCVEWDVTDRLPVQRRSGAPSKSEMIEELRRLLDLAIHERDEARQALAREREESKRERDEAREHSSRLLAKLDEQGTVP